MPDKMSQEKIGLLRAYGAEVIITPTAVPPDSPESYYRVADRLAEEIPGAFQPNQYWNPQNPQTHYETTGPEIWDQTDGTVDVFVAGVGTGGTISGVGRYLKERNPDIMVVGADPEGSVYSGDQPRPYLVEGIGEDFWPGTFDPAVVDRYVKVSDRDSFLTARAVTRQEGILVGGSCGTAVFAALQVAREFDAERRSWCCCRTPAAATCRRSTPSPGCCSTACSSAPRRSASTRSWPPRAVTCPRWSRSMPMRRCATPSTS